MHRIDHETATSDNKFTEGNPTVPIPATVVTDDWLNAVQEEIAGAIEASGQTLDKSNNNQLAAAFGSVTNPKRYRWTLSAAVAANGQITLPSSGQYTVGKGARLWYLGLYLTEGTHWQSVGNEGAASTKIKLLFAADQGDEFVLETPQ